MRKQRNISARVFVGSAFGSASDSTTSVDVHLTMSSTKKLTTQEMIDENVWHDISELPEFIETIRHLSTAGMSVWHWSKGDWANKYITLRFDMRDGGFILRNEKGRIGLEDLRAQRGD